jgi:uncharacterized membrane protein
MNRIALLLLAVSLGLNAGLLYVRLAERPAQGTERPDRLPAPRRASPPAPEVVVQDHLLAMTRHLTLSQEQQRSIRAVLDEHMPMMMELLRRGDEANRRISEAFAAPEFDTERFKILVQEASQARARADSLSAVMLLGEAAVLTAQQRIKYAEIAPTVHANPPRKPPPPRRRP